VFLEMKLNKNRQTGFTLIEMMVVIVILGVIVAIAYPQYRSAQTRAKEASTKANMSAFRTMVEIYNAMYSGIYPSNVNALINEPEMRNSQVWKELYNPYTNLPGKGFAYNDESAPKVPGVFTYSLVTDVYALYGYDSNMQRITQRGITFYLTNQ
jgi:type II secretion system protein G